MRTAAAILIAGSAFLFSAFNSEPPAGVSGALHPFYLPYQYSSFADDTALYANAYREAEASETTDGLSRKGGEHAGGVPARAGSVIAGTISHHLFIRNLIAEYFRELAREVHPKTIILLGPNHHARGRSPIAVSELSWRTPFGFVEPDRETIGKIALTGLASIEEEPFVNEHSIGALVPFIRRSFPHARIVPVIFKKVANGGDCVRLGKALAGLLDSTIVLASLDFSHYKTSREAEQEDVSSMAVLTSLSPERIDEAYVDSRPALLTLIALCRQTGAKRVDVVQHTNSGILSHNPLVPCTSYINTFIRYF